MKKNVLHISQYSAEYEGNFIASLKQLELRLISKNINIIYVFPLSAKDQQWMSKFSTEHQVFFVKNPSDSGVIDQISLIIEKTLPVIIHSHFDGYDIPICKSIKKAKVNFKPRIIWHLHNPLYYQKSYIKKAYQKIRFLEHYSFFSKKYNVSAVAVSPEIASFVIDNGFNKNKIEVIENGLVLDRIDSTISKIENKSFIAFAGRPFVKGMDTLLAACEILKSDSKDFILTIVASDQARMIIEKDLLHDEIPEWLRIVQLSSDINVLLKKSSCFISSSRAETFSYAVCEAIYFGLPVILSNIDGTRWAWPCPSVKVYPCLDAFSLYARMKEHIALENNLSDNIRLELQQSQQYIYNRYSIDIWIEKIVSFYKKIIDL